MSKEDDFKLDENGSYSVTDYISRIMKFSEVYKDDPLIQEFATDTIEWANGLKPDATVRFAIGSDGLLHPYSDISL